MKSLYFGLALAAALAAPAYAQPSSIVTTDGKLCPADNLCSPVDAGDGSFAFIHDADLKSGFGYIAIQFGKTPPAEGEIEFLLGNAPSTLQFCGFSFGRTTQGGQWPVTSQLEWASSQSIGGKFASTVKYRVAPGSLTANGVYAFTFQCSTKPNAP